jgi:hypothetical protein
MRNLLYIVCILRVVGLFAQNQHDDNINALVEQYIQNPELKCEITIQIDVEGMRIPDKKLIVDFRKDKKPKVKSEGLALLPKKGTIDQFSKLLSSPFQAIYISKTEKNLVYKLVSLDPKSDWITADITFDEKTYLIYRSVVNTRKFGSFQSDHSYKEKIYPFRSIITFEVKKFKIPLKFIGREQGVTSSIPDKEKNVQGKITLIYKYL